MTAKQIIKVIESDGWYFYEQKGSHRHFLHAIKTGKVTVPFHSSRDLPKFVVANIYRQAGLK